MKTVTLVGVGALGSHAALLLRNEAQLRLIDYDRVEQKNVLAQFHGKGSIGKYKVSSSQGLLALLFNVKVDALPREVTADNVEQLLSGSDLVLDCLDNGPGRRLVQAFIREKDIPCIHGALASEGQLGRVVWDADFVPDDAADGAATCRAGELLPFIGVVAAYLARAAQEFLRAGRKIGFSVTPLGGATVL